MCITCLHLVFTVSGVTVSGGSLVASTEAYSAAWDVAMIQVRHIYPLPVMLILYLQVEVTIMGSCMYMCSLVYVVEKSRA